MAPCKVQWGITTYTYSPRAKQIFAYAGDEAKRLGAQRLVPSIYYWAC